MNKFRKHIRYKNYDYSVTIKSQEKSVDLSKIITHFKAISISNRGSKKSFTQAGINYKYNSIWQKNFYEEIIKDEYHYYFVEEYILSNPERWKK